MTTLIIFGKAQTMSETMKRQKSVCFQATDDVIQTISIHEYTLDEINSCWYSKQEQEQHREDAKQTIIRMNSGGISLDDIEFCRRGLETFHGRPKRVKVRNRRLACKVVMDLQLKQWREGFEDNEKVAAAYLDVCTTSQKMARLAGISDAIASEQLLYDCPIPHRFCSRRDRFDYLEKNKKKEKGHKQHASVVRSSSLLLNRWGATM